MTYHGPGQQVMYVMVDLKRSKVGVRQLVTAIEDTVINTLAHFRLNHAPVPMRPACTWGAENLFVGFADPQRQLIPRPALNVAMDLSPFQRINPCGYAGMQMTQVSALAPDVGIEDIHPITVQEFVHLLGYQTVELRNWNLHDYE